MSSRQDKKLRKEVKRVITEQALTIVKPRPKWAPLWFWKFLIRLVIK